jgi:hypothetical protein
MVKPPAAMQKEILETSKMLRILDEQKNVFTLPERYQHASISTYESLKRFATLRTADTTPKAASLNKDLRLAVIEELNRLKIECTAPPPNH